MIAKQLITSHVLPLKPTDTGAFALLNMEESRLSHLPVVDGITFVTIVSDKEILAIDLPELEIGHYQVAPITTSVKADQHFYEVLKLFSTFKLTMLPVITDNNVYLGAIVLPTIVNAMSEMVGINDPGGVIVLEINDKDYSLAEIVHVVESNDTKILSCFVTSHKESTILDVTIKLNRIEIGPLLQAFYRLNYLVTSSWSKEDSYNEGIQDRFDALMNYLNI